MKNFKLKIIGLVCLVFTLSITCIHPWGGHGGFYSVSDEISNGACAESYWFGVRVVRGNNIAKRIIEWLFIEDEELKDITEQYLFDPYLSYIFQMIKNSGCGKIYIIEDREAGVSAGKMRDEKRLIFEERYQKKLEKNSGELNIDDRIKMWPSRYARLVLEHENWHIYMDFEIPKNSERFYELLGEWESFFPGEDAVEKLGLKAVLDGVNFLPTFIRGALSNIALARFQIQKGFDELSSKEIRETIIEVHRPDVGFSKEYIKLQFILYYSRTVLPFEIEAELKKSQSGSQKEVEQLENYRDEFHNKLINLYLNEYKCLTDNEINHLITGPIKRLKALLISEGNYPAIDKLWQALFEE